MFSINNYCKINKSWHKCNWCCHWNSLFIAHTYSWVILLIFYLSYNFLPCVAHVDGSLIFGTHFYSSSLFGDRVIGMLMLGCYLFMICYNFKKFPSSSQLFLVAFIRHDFIFHCMLYQSVFWLFGLCGSCQVILWFCAREVSERPSEFQRLCLLLLSHFGFISQQTGCLILFSFHLPICSFCLLSYIIKLVCLP